MTVYEGSYQVTGKKPAIVIARFNEFITSKLLTGALDMFSRHGIAEENVDVYWVPGAFEIPFMAKKLVESGRYDGIVALGAVIRGATSHYDLVCSEVAKGVAQINLSALIPVMFGVVTTDNIEQAIERSGTKAGNKGSDSALGLLEMMSLSAQLQ